ncbi:MAG: NADP oxidoreductase [Martelella sp.]|uniref:NADPH-dependent F420 reductase n=1 Tax=unclassified Martelella TaxID=2629616 RepID=UPI000C6A53DD|nr:NAD(P)-binding domain-containing protein [Martelella sp.]MAU18982.1 NADP oxidoreductase [Martelella sp.]|tara:strand:+ start:2148 stop:2756 length:609 start_codon:yes stop_codon:yes gene_type:complete
MKIGILGAGTVGTTLGTHLAAAGHQILITNGRETESLAETVRGLDQPLEPVTVDDLLDQAEMILLAVPWRNVRDVLRKDIDWGGRIVVDATNIILSIIPDIQIDNLEGDSGSEIVARLAPSARVVKAFNTLPFETMFAPVPTGFRRVLFVAGDDPDAVSAVSGLIEQIGFQSVAIGPLATAGRQMEIGGTFSRLELFATDAA